MEIQFYQVKKVEYLFDKGFVNLNPPPLPIPQPS